MSKQLPSVTIIGRQNVGKSTLFNALIREKKAIVDEYAGLTRDVISFTMNFEGSSFVLSDTPGLDLPGSAELSSAIMEKAYARLESSSAVIFLMEYPGPEAYDWKLVEMVRRLSVPSIIAVNKMDNNERMENMSMFYEMGIQDLIPISALNRKNISLLLSRLTQMLPKVSGGLRDPDITIALAGRPNSGKSTLLNSFLGYDRAVVSDIPGTTRDSVDDFFNYHGKLIRVVDTAGIRRKSKAADGIEFYSFKRTLDAIKKCDVVIHLIDASAGITETDKKISDAIISEGKPVILAVNKWDLIEKDHKTFDEFRDKIVFKFYRADDFPIISISAMNRLRTDRILKTALELKERASVRVETPRLNRAIAKMLDSGRLPQTGGKLKIYYAAQTDTVPPKFRFFVNDASLFRPDMVRYFEKSIQKEFDMKGIPVIIQLEGKKHIDREERLSVKKNADSSERPSGKSSGKKVSKRPSRN